MSFTCSDWPTGPRDTEGNQNSTHVTRLPYIIVLQVHFIKTTGTSSNFNTIFVLGCSVIDTWPLTRAIQDSLQVPHTHDRPLSQVSCSIFRGIVPYE
jgi:hypothetical protein